MLGRQYENKACKGVVSMVIFLTNHVIFYCWQSVKQF